MAASLAASAPPPLEIREVTPGHLEIRGVHPSLEPLGIRFCANCVVFDWYPPEDQSILRKCGKCKVLEYCSVDCQAEHWDVVHKKHCKKLKLAKDAAGEKDSPTFPIGLFSHHPFPMAGLLGDTIEMLTILIQRTLFKMQQTGHPAWDLPVVRQLEKVMRENRQVIWAWRKLGPEKEITSGKMVRFDHLLYWTSGRSFDGLFNDLWSTLNLVLGRLSDYLTLVEVSRLREPHKTVPEEVWRDVLNEVGPFSTRLQELISAFFGNGAQVPSFLDLLEVLCGGSLKQKCSFCNVNVTVAAMVNEVDGISGKVPTVILRPHFPVFFTCAAASCFLKFSGQAYIWSKWELAVRTSSVKMALMECDFCFKLTEDVHRLSYV